MPEETKKEVQAEGTVVQDILIQNMKIMHQIVSEMKEVPILESEKPKDVSPLTKVEFPENGGVLTFMEGHEYPYKGFPAAEFVDRIDLLKKVIRTTLSGFYHELKGKSKLKLLTLLPALWVARHGVRTGIYTFYRIIDRFKMKEFRYSSTVRELHRAFSVEIPKESVKDKEIRLMLRDGICMLLEFDNAYRYRFQDIIAELNRENARKNIIGELKRLLTIMQSREKTPEVRDTWTLFKLLVSLYLRFDKGMKTLISNVLVEIDTGKAALDEGDKHYCNPRQDYTFGYMK